MRTYLRSVAQSPILALALATVILLVPAAGRADPPVLGMPIDCTPGEDCWILKYVDADPGPGYADYTCAHRTSPAHKGTDLMVSAEAMEAGVPVLAAAAGRVVGTRDEMADVPVTLIGGPKALDNKDCGNGVRLDHGDGWSTQYCHLRRSSIAVKEGDSVEAGAMLGLVGLSGATERPHIHMTLEKDGQVIDPFVGVEGGADCAVGTAPLWASEILARLPNRPSQIVGAGIVGSTPDKIAIHQGYLDRLSLPATSPVMMLWADLLDVRAGDTLSLRLTGPDGGTLAEKEQVYEKRLNYPLYWIGKRRPGDAWPTGVYDGTVTLTPAAGGAPRQKQVSVVVE